MLTASLPWNAGGQWLPMSDGDDPKRARNKPQAAPAATPVASPKPGQRAPGPAPAKGRVGGPESAFDIWLDRDLHRMFDKVRAEPIPEDLLRLIDCDRKKS